MLYIILRRTKFPISLDKIVSTKEAKKSRIILLKATQVYGRKCNNIMAFLASVRSTRRRVSNATIRRDCGLSSVEVNVAPGTRLRRSFFARPDQTFYSLDLKQIFSRVITTLTCRCTPLVLSCSDENPP